jgi:phytoene dehydrogenase-like protein
MRLEVLVSREVVDALVVGAGFGGLGAALSLAERGAWVVIYEALKYPGGHALLHRARPPEPAR